MDEYTPKELPDRSETTGKWDGIDYRYYKQPKMKCSNCGAKDFKCLGVEIISHLNYRKENSTWQCLTCGNPVTKTKEKK